MLVEISAALPALVNSFFTLFFAYNATVNFTSFQYRSILFLTGIMCLLIAKTKKTKKKTIPISKFDLCLNILIISPNNTLGILNYLLKSGLFSPLNILSL